jgi:hypothetical protein
VLRQIRAIALTLVAQKYLADQWLHNGLHIDAAIGANLAIINLIQPVPETLYTGYTNARLPPARVRL